MNQSRSLSSASSPDPIALLPDSLRLLLADTEAFREYNTGDLVVGPENWDERIRFIISGELSLVLRDDEGEKLSVDQFGVGDIFGEIPFFTGSPWPSDSELVAEGSCRVLIITPEYFEQLLKEDPSFTVPLVRKLARRVISLQRAVFKGVLKKRALKNLISRQEHVFPDYMMGDFYRRKIAARVEELSQSDAPLLIIGESGVGKEGVAHSIYRKSHHCKEVFLQTDIRKLLEESYLEGVRSELPGTDSELTSRQERVFFGAEQPGRGGSLRKEPGYFELTEGGTLLVRGVEHLTRTMQMKLLEALVTETFRRQGGVTLQKAKVRFIATTRLHPDDISLERHPLLFALLDQAIVIPPLRTRRKEIPNLIERYIKKYSQELRGETLHLPDETLKALVNHAWPGNEFELATTLKRAILVSEDSIIRPRDIYFDLRRVEGQGRFNLLRLRIVKQMLLSPLYPAVLQSAATPFFFILLAFLFLGPQDPLRNPAALFGWALGWPILILGAFFCARAWCAICPIGTIGKLAKKVISLERPFPESLRNHSDFLIAGAVLFIIWFETATGLRNYPAALGVLLLVMLCSAVLVAIVFERQSWCLYLCGLGGMIGVLAKTSLIELRANRNVCMAQCSSNLCFAGTDTREGCPFGQSGPRLDTNRLCKLCGTCVKNCPHGAINLNVRIPGQELSQIRQGKAGTAFLVVGLIGGLFSELASKSVFYEMVSAAWPLPEVVEFTLFFICLVALVNLMMVVSAFWSSRIYKDTFQANYSRYGMALLPLTLAAFMAFHLYYLINLGVQLPILLSHNFDFELLRSLIITVPAHVTHWFQRIVIVIGLAWSLAVIYSLGRANHPDRIKALMGMAPHMLLAIVLAYLLLKALASFFYTQ
ncbi:MAG: sigma 54-interacting transcriptional regulator [Thermodesulfobacteriota bacterium]